jgi:hypothetical protein
MALLWLVAVFAGKLCYVYDYRLFALPWHSFHGFIWKKQQEKQRALMLDTTCMHSWWHVWIACCLVDPTLLW